MPLEEEEEQCLRQRYEDVTERRGGAEGGRGNSVS